MTDYSKVKGILLSFPEGHKDIDNANLASFYIELINLIPNDIEISIICTSKEVFEKVKSLSPEANLKMIVEPDFQEIWLRDMIGFKSRNNYILPKYNPTYFKENYTEDKLFNLRANSAYFMSKVFPNCEIKTSQINIDGGNLITNGEIGFVTEKLKEDNPRDNNQIPIEEEFEQDFGIKPFYLKHFPADKLGHADGIIAFLNNRTVALSKYPDYLKSLTKEREYLNELKEELEYQRFKVVSIYDRPIDEKIKAYGDWLYGARGIYINFLRLNDTIILPQFNLPMSKGQIDYNSYNKEILEKEGFKVLTLQCDDLCRLGGGLRCISWVY